MAATAAMWRFMDRELIGLLQERREAGLSLVPFRTSRRGNSRAAGPRAARGPLRGAHAARIFTQVELESTDDGATLRTHRRIVAHGILLVQS